MDWEGIFARLRGAVSQGELPSVSQISHDSLGPFGILIATVISLRTKDNVTLAAARRLFARAADPLSMLRLSPAELEQLIFPAGFYRQKAKQILAICRLLLQQHGGVVPSSREELLALPGVGLKTANLTLSLGFAIPAICVDTHVHRICNRLGWICTATPDQSEAALRQLLPQNYWIEINELLVKYGQQVCTPQSPFCSRCTLARDCARVGVGRSR